MKFDARHVQRIDALAQLSGFVDDVYKAGNKLLVRYGDIAALKLTRPYLMDNISYLFTRYILNTIVSIESILFDPVIVDHRRPGVGNVLPITHARFICQSPVSLL
jgi:hypothetical protein